MEIMKDLKRNISKIVGNTKTSILNTNEKVNLKKIINKNEIKLYEYFCELGKFIYENNISMNCEENNIYIDEMLSKIKDLQLKIEFDKKTSYSVEHKYRLKKISNKISKNNSNLIMFKKKE